jgi:hypothetical protein
MTGIRTSIILPLLSIALLAGGAALAQPLPPAPADGGRLNIRPLNFDLWCQETQHLPPERCDKRLPADDAAFNDYRAKVEKYEVPYLKRKENAATLNRTIIHAEPTQNPANNSQQPPAPNP